MITISVLYPDLPQTNYPNSIDTFFVWLNITANDGILVQKYMEAMEAGNQVLADQVLAQIPSASQKIIKATDLNKMSQAIQAIERFYLNDIKPFIETKQEEWLAIINRFRYQGPWNPGTQYFTNNIVSYVVEGLTLLYIATDNPPVGVGPTNTNYWRLLTIQGQPGPAGPGLSYRQEWKSSVQYEANQAVTYGGALWMSVQPSINVPPGSNEEYWKPVITLRATTYPIQSETPIGQEQKGLWFDTSIPTNFYQLDPLPSPADASTIWKGKQAYGADGARITGTLETYNKQEIDTKVADIDARITKNKNDLSNALKDIPVSDIRNYVVKSGITINAGQIVNIESNQVTNAVGASQGIALEDGVAGATIAVGFGGYCKLDSATQGQTFTSDGVTAYAPVDGWIDILPYYQNKKEKPNPQIVSYVGNGKFGADNPCSITADFPIEAIYYIGGFDTTTKSLAQNTQPVTNYMLADALTNSYVDGTGICLGAGDSCQGKRNENAQAFSWYHVNSAEKQANLANRYYSFLVIPRA